MQIVKIIPQVKLPRQITGVFDYAINDNIAHKVQVGQLCLVPFRNQEVLGLIYSKPIKLKSSPLAKAPLSVKKIFDFIPRLPGHYLQLIKWLRQYYFNSLTLAVYHFLPRLEPKFIPKPRLHLGEIHNSSLLTNILGKNYLHLKINRASITYLKKVLDLGQIQNKNFLLDPTPLLADSLLKYVVYFKIIQNILKNNQKTQGQAEQILILRPTIVEVNI